MSNLSARFNVPVIGQGGAARGNPDNRYQHAARHASGTTCRGSCFPAARLTVMTFAHKPAVCGSRSQASNGEPLGFARYSEPSKWKRDFADGFLRMLARKQRFHQGLRHRSWCFSIGQSGYCAFPTVSAMTAPRVPRGLLPSTVESCVV
jgi:hypothetical protein